MVDIHCHILPGLDDGADTFEESVQMAEMAIEDGITHVVGTPHANDQFRFDPDLIKKRRNELQEKIGPRLMLATGCDFHFNFENLQDIETNRTKYTINQKNYLLVELNDFSIPPNIDDTFHHLQLLGIAPIITHPERNPLVRRDPTRSPLAAPGLLRTDHGAIVAGPIRARRAKVRRGVAGQRHGPLLCQRRPQRHAQALAAQRSLPGRRRAAGDLIARALFRENPLAAFEGRPLPYEPEQPDVSMSSRGPRRKRFGFF